MDISKAKTVHMVGIKGVGMTALAQLLIARGAHVTGSDITEKFFTDEVLERAGISVTSFDPEIITPAIDVVIYSTAYDIFNIELARAQELGIAQVSYPEALAQLFNTAKGVAIAGSHGKTTSSALLGFTMRELAMDPTVVVGSRVIDFGGNAVAGKGEYFVIEADEYQNKLARYSPKIAMITSIDYDHPDFFPDRESYALVFNDFASRVMHDGGKVVVCVDDVGVQEMLRTLPIGDGVVSYGFDIEARYCVSNYHIEDNATHFTVSRDGEVLGEFSTLLVGRHNASNACGVIAILDMLGVDNWAAVASIIGRFQGTARRFERKGAFGDIVVIDDYAHHPTEVRATLDAALEVYSGKRIWCVFSAHTFSRTSALLEEFGKSFTSVDRVLLLDIYASAREQGGTVHARDLAELINHSGVPCEYVGTLEHAAEYVREHAHELDVLITMGAGDAWRVGDMLLGKE